MAAARDQNGRKRASKWDTPAANTGTATEAAREAARKLNAMLAAKGKLTTNAPPPLLPPKPKSTAGTSSTSSSSSASSVFTEEIEINDSPRRLLLCQGNVQYEISKYSGTAVSTKGQYIDPSTTGNMTGQKPLYLFIQSTSRDKVNLAVQRVRGIMNGDDPFVQPPHPPQQMIQSNQTSTLPSGMYYIQEKVFVGLDNVQPEFNLKDKILGPGESYFHHITKETGAKVHLRGRGSGFIEPTSGREAFEALYVYISHTNYPGLHAAKKLVENLIGTVHTAYQQFQQTSNPVYYPNYGGYPSQNTEQQHPPPMYNTPPISRFGPPPRSSGPPQPSYPYPPHPNQPPPHFNQPGANHSIPPNPQMPPHRPRYPNPALRHESPRPLMDQHPPYREMNPYTPESPTQLSISHPDQRTFYTPESPTHAEPPSSDYNTFLPSDHRSREDIKQKKSEEKPTEPTKPAKRRFTEAPAKKATTSDHVVQESLSEKPRSVSSLDQQSHAPNVDADAKTVAMAPPVLPAPKTQLNDANVKKEKTKTPVGFKMPMMPISSVISSAKKKLPAQPAAHTAGIKRKHEEARDEEKKPDVEKKSTGIALLGSYDDDSSDED